MYNTVWLNAADLCNSLANSFKYHENEKNIDSDVAYIAGSFGIANAQTSVVMVSDAAGWYKIGEKQSTSKRIATK
ncbi:MAG: hypothetical protein WCR72_03095 [Bacteroidota bacterium]